MFIHELKTSDQKYVQGLITIIHHDSDREVVASADVLRYVLGVTIDKQDVRHAMRLSTVMRLAGWEQSKSGRVSINKKQVRSYIATRENPKRSVS